MITLFSLLIANAEAGEHPIHGCNDPLYGRFVMRPWQVGVGVVGTTGGTNAAILPPPGYEGKWMEYEPLMDTSLQFIARRNDSCVKFAQYALTVGMSNVGWGGRLEAGKSILLEDFVEFGYSLGLATHYSPYDGGLESVLELSLPLSVRVGAKRTMRFSIYPMFGAGVHIEPAHEDVETLVLPATRSGVRFGMYWLR